MSLSERVGCGIFIVPSVNSSRRIRIIFFFFHVPGISNGGWPASTRCAEGSRAHALNVGSELYFFLPCTGDLVKWGMARLHTVHGRLARARLKGISTGVKKNVHNFPLFGNILKGYFIWYHFKWICAALRFILKEHDEPAFNGLHGDLEEDGRYCCSFKHAFRQQSSHHHCARGIFQPPSPSNCICKKKKFQQRRQQQGSNNFLILGKRCPRKKIRMKTAGLLLFCGSFNVRSASTTTASSFAATAPFTRYRWLQHRGWQHSCCCCSSFSSSSRGSFIATSSSCSSSCHGSFITRCCAAAITFIKSSIRQEKSKGVHCFIATAERRLEPQQSPSGAVAQDERKVARSDERRVARPKEPSRPSPSAV